MKVIAVIPARFGSKGVPGKNTIEINGKPLIEYSIEAALESNKLFKIWISSDSERVWNISKRYKRVFLHKRCEKLATDDSPISDTILEIIKQEDQNIDAVLLLQPTSPIRTGKQIDEAISLFEKNPGANSLISVCAMNEIHPARMYWKTKDSLSPILDGFEETRRQEIPTAFFRNGSIYIIRIKPFLKNHKVMIKPSIGYVMPSSQLLNIDEPRDIIMAEALMLAWKKGII